jgi:prevent-host-death family protein
MEKGIKEAKNSLSKLVDAVLAGEEVFLTNRGDRVAQIIPVRKAVSLKRARGLFKDKINLYPGWDSEAEDLKIERMFETNLNG